MSPLQIMKKMFDHPKIIYFALFMSHGNLPSSCQTSRLNTSVFGWIRRSTIRVRFVDLSYELMTRSTKARSKEAGKLKRKECNFNLLSRKDNFWTTILGLCHYIVQRYTVI